MRCLVGVLLFASAAYAHGGGGFRGPLERGVPCTCALRHCRICAPKKVAACASKTTVLRTWDDVARVRIRLTFTTDETVAEGFESLEPGALFAVTGGRVGESTAALRSELDARQRFLFERRSPTGCSLLVLRRGPGRVDVRVFPVRKGAPVEVTLEGYLTRPPPLTRVGPRVYRTDKDVLVVTDTRDGRRAFRFAVRPPDGARPVAVPFVRALATAQTGWGAHAAGRLEALAALPPDSRLPPFIGPDRRMFLPPGVIDPPPPAPPKR